MNLRKKKELASEVFKVGKDRLVFVESRLSDLKEAITKQDLKDLKEDGAIIIKEIKGRRKVEKRKRKRGPGKVKKKVNSRKTDYVLMTRKLRGYVSELQKQGKISKEEETELRKKIRNKAFKSKANLRDIVMGVKK